MNQPLIGRYYLTSRLAPEYRPALEELIFFNDRQSRISAALKRAVTRYGSPQIKVEGDRLLIELASVPQVQSLFVLKDGRHPQLAGTVIYTRQDNCLRVIYVGLDEAHAYFHHKPTYLLVEIFRVVAQIGRRIRNVEFIEFDSGDRPLRLPVG